MNKSRASIFAMSALAAAAMGAGGGSYRPLPGSNYTVNRTQPTPFRDGSSTDLKDIDTGGNRQRSSTSHKKRVRAKNLNWKRR